MGLHLKLGLFFISMLASAPAPAQSDRVCARTDSSGQHALQILQFDCERTVTSDDCQQLYQRLQANGEDPDKFQLKCTEENLRFSLNNLGNAYIGCAIGGWSFVADGFVATGTAIGEATAYMVLSAEKEREINLKCDSSLVEKKKIFRIYNNSVPQILRVREPSTADLERKQCALLKAELISAKNQKLRIAESRYGHIEEVSSSRSAEVNEFVQWNKEQKIHALPRSEEASLIRAIEAELGKLDINLRCLNMRKSSEIICEGIAALGAGVSMLTVLGRSRSLRSLALSQSSWRNQLSPSQIARLTKAESKLGSLTQTQWQAIERAHLVGRGSIGADGVNAAQVGNYTWSQIRNKNQILKTQFPDAKDRRFLLQNGVAGDDAWVDDIIRAENKLSEIEQELVRAPFERSHLGETARIRSQLDDLLDLPEEMAVKELQRINIEIENLKAAPKVSRADESVKALEITDRSQVRLQDILVRGQPTNIRAPGGSVRTVVLDKAAVKELMDDKSAVGEKLFESMKKGLLQDRVDPQKVKLLPDQSSGASGVFFEVRTTERGHPRLFGCVSGNVYRVKMFVRHAPEEKHTYLRKYRDLCK